MSGQNIIYVQEQLGHASIRVTMDMYGHLFEEIKFNRQQVELFEGIFNSVRNPLENECKNAEGATASAVTP
jgi:hypothetical protein